MEREKRTKFPWNFCEYFLLQDQFAIVYENMGIYGESLIQYDDVEASAVLNSIVGNIPTWLDEFTNNLADWNPLFLEKAAQM